ncbi:MAG: hypothetical protein IT352_12785 [Gemmatimonadales bacterium]|nr:hypothetical protein [Gemmatimonadales bacterium]
MRGVWIAAMVMVVGLGCRGRAPGAADQSALQATVDSLVPQVEKAVGLTFRTKPRFAVRTKEEVKAYLLSKLSGEFPTAKIEGITAAYQLLELIPDTLDIKALLLPLYAEQVAGYYDPDSTTLYAVEGAKEDQLRLVLAHELVHALQHEQLPLESLLKDVTNADRMAASQAVLEGHATIAMLGVVLGEQAAAAGGPDALLADPDFWFQYRESVKTAQTSMPVFRSAPLILREGLIFPYLGGAEFMRWWDGQPGKGPLPSRDQLPKSTEQILHPDRYLANDGPVPVEFAEPADGVLHEDTMGELELQIWSAQLRGGGEVLDDLPLGWGGDRFRVYRTATGPALVIYTVWDDSTSARRFATLTGSRFVGRPRQGYRTDVAALSLAGRPAVRVVRAPEGWDRWASLPEAVIGGASPTP